MLRPLTPSTTTDAGPVGLAERDDDTQALGRVARGSSANLLGALVTAITTFAVTIVVTRSVSQDRAGVFFSATSLFLLATTIGQLGTGTGLVYFVARFRALGAPHLAARYVRVALRPVLVTAIAMGVAVFVFAAPLADLVLPGRSAETTSYLRVLALFIPLVGIEAVWLAATRGLGVMTPTNLVEQIGRPVAQLLLVVAAVSAGLTGWLSWAWAFAYAPAAIAAWWWWRRLAPTDEPVGLLAGEQAGELASGLADEVGAETTHAREFWRFTWPRALTSVVQIVLQRFDIVLVGAMAGAAPAAIYAAATRFIVAGQVGGNAITFAAQPRLSETIARGDKAATNLTYQTSTGWLMVITWPLYLMLIVFGAPLLQVFGASYDAGSTVLVLLAGSMLVATGCGVVDVVLAMAGHTSWNLANATLSLAVNIGLDVWLIPAHGVLGAAIGWAVAIVVRNLSALIQVGLAIGLHPIGRSTIVAAVLSVGAFAIVPLLARLWLGDSWGGLGVGVLVGGAIYLAGLWHFRRDLRLDALLAGRRRTG